MRNLCILSIFTFVVSCFSLSTAYADPSVNIACSEISMVSYTKSGTTPHKVIIRLRDGRFFHFDSIAEPTSLEKASALANDLKNCRNLLMYYTTLSATAFNVTTYQVFLR
ncbi:MAG: hypothetical protein HYY62_05520 [Deltaproteobacteria bacterium]|nr:hypothetical protein [Deltaproteobacteria bacterium]